MHKLTSVWGLVFSLLPAICSAIGLGNIKVQSALNEAFKAEVRILDLGATPLNQVQAALATPNEFKKIQTSPPAYLSKFRFEITRDKNNRPLVLITSTDPIDEPVVTLFMSLNAPNGRLLRLYTVFLDPPDYSAMPTMEAPPTMLPQFSDPSPPLPFVEPPPIGAVGQEILVERVKPGEVRLASSVVSQIQPSKVAVSQNRTAEKIYGPIRMDDTLWRIAKQYTSSSLSQKQAVIAIYYRNPHAFALNNMNGLKSGYKLVIPSPQEMASISYQKASEEMIKQNQSWKQAHNATADVDIALVSFQKAANIPLVKTNTALEQKSLEQKSLLQSNTHQTSHTMTAEQWKPTVKMPALNNASVPHLLNVNAAQTMQKTSLIAPLTILQSTASSQNINNMIKPITLQSSTTSGVEGQLQHNEAQTMLDDTEHKVIEAKLALTVEALKAARATNDILKNKVAQLEQQHQRIHEQLSQKEAQVLTLQQPLNPERSFALQTPLPTMKSNTALKSISTFSNLPVAQNGLLRLILILILLVAVMVLGGFYWQHRRYKQLHTQTTSFIDEERLKLSPESKLEEQSDEALKKEKSENIQSGTELDLQEEISILMSYGRYIQAEALLKKALETDPENNSLKVMLLEDYVLTDNQFGFQAVYEQLPAELKDQDPALWNKVAALIEQVKLQSAQKRSSLNPTADVVTLFDEPLPLLPVVSAPSNSIVSEALPTETAMEQPVDSTVALGAAAREQMVKDRASPEPERPVDELSSIEPIVEKVPDSNMIDFNLDPDQGLALDKSNEIASPPTEPHANMIEFATLQKGSDAPIIEPVISPELAVPAAKLLDREIATKLDLARVYIDMEDFEEAKSLLNDVMSRGNEDHQKEAQILLKRI